MNWSSHVGNMDRKCVITIQLTLLSAQYEFVRTRRHHQRLENGFQIRCGTNLHNIKD